jgi:hypothetical protein
MMTGCVVWYDFELRAISKTGKRVPIFDPELDYLVYEGPVDIEQFPRFHKNYSLNFSAYDQSKFTVVPLASEYRPIVKLSRAKCYALNVINNLAERAMERNGVVDQPLFNSHIIDSDIVDIYQRQLGLNKLSAGKLLKFNRDEHSINIRNIKNIQIEGELAVIKSKTVEDVVAEFVKFSSEMGGFDISPEMVTRYL